MGFGVEVKWVERKCPVCGNAHYRHRFTDINRREGIPISADIVECSTCKMKYINPTPCESALEKWFGEYAAGYPETEESPVPRNVNQRQSAGRTFVRFINGLLRGHPHDWPEEVGNDRTILDFGCYDGRKLEQFYQSGWNVTGIDTNVPAIQSAKRRMPEGAFYCAEISNFAYRNEFDFIRSDNVFEHLIEPLDTLITLYRFLKPGGAIRLFVPNGASFSALVARRYSAVYWMPFHVNLFTPKALHMLLERAGFTSIIVTTFSPIGSWLWTLRQLTLSPGFNMRHRNWLDQIIWRTSLLNYPGETLAQWVGLGEELIVTAHRAP
jgi:SAM-dependent methyltransferase